MSLVGSIRQSKSAMQLSSTLGQLMSSVEEDALIVGCYIWNSYLLKVSDPGEPGVVVQ